MGYKLGYIDEDLGQQTTFYHYFKDLYDDVKSFEITENTTIESLIIDIEKYKVDILVIDFELTGNGFVNFDAHQFLKSFLKKYPHYPYVILTGNEDDAYDHINDVNKIYTKEALPESIEHFNRILLKSIDNYHNEIAENEKIIRVFSEKKNKKGLTLFEEEAFYKAHMYMDEISYKEMPTQMTTYQGITQLSDFLNETKEIKEMLKNLM
ncbi:MAG: hypothetical protein PHN18_07130 [Sulfurospirillaceae bacterium]|nr:hypothetical protein [Sulfurospirillaceae bacterium]MDD2827169.1 hypothetical protein [Sulfurospirillaceae bacterium]